jgi:hypothetical protein
MEWLSVGSVLALILGIAALLPYGSLRKAAANARRPNGRRSPRRIRRELHHAAVFFRSAALVPLVALLLLQGALFAVHAYVVPDATTLSDLFGTYHPEVSLHAPDLEAWDEAIRADQRDRAYDAWKHEQGLASVAPPAVSEFLLEHWPLHVVFSVLPLAFLTWFFRGPYLIAARAYHLGVVQRSKQYALHLATST